MKTDTARTARTTRSAARGPRIAWATVLVVAVIAAAAYFTVRGKGGRSGPRHVIIISLDTTRADHFGFYGNRTIRTPNFDRLAGESIVFDDYSTVVPTTLASHTSLFTGTYAHTHGVPRNGFIVGERNLLLAELLHERGFQNFAFLGSFALDRSFGVDAGFDYYEDDRFDMLLRSSGQRDQNQRRADQVTDSIIAYLSAHGVPQRMFLFAHYFDPHLPYDPPSPYDRMYDPDGLPADDQLMTLRVDVERGVVTQDAPIVAKLTRQYAGEISYMDEHVGRLLAYLRERKILDDAIVLVTSDHGEQFAEHRVGAFDHGDTVYQTAARCVGLVRLPRGEHGGTRVAASVRSIDMFPTLLNQLGIPLPPGVEGEAIDLAHAAGTAPRVVFCEATKPHGPQAAIIERGARWLNQNRSKCAREGQWKYIETPWQKSSELYDLTADPLEQRNLLASGPSPEAVEAARRLRARLSAWSNAANPLPALWIGMNTAMSRDQRAAAVKNLGALGYVGGAPTATEPSATQPATSQSAGTSP
ncbi:MAG: hypothetical protein CHACPFDD_02673 [Phycisphaerae bacterium]|nr:hypothetical protein [Phycisphaerae bacterium]